MRNVVLLEITYVLLDVFGIYPPYEHSLLLHTLPPLHARPSSASLTNSYSSFKT